MAEDFNDYGSYRKYLEDEEFKSRPLIRKIFSFRALKFAIKWFGYLLIISVFAILFWRMFSSRNPKQTSELIWTKNSYAAYETLGNDLLIYTQDVGKTFDKDGKFSIYELRYIPATDELQFTIRYNKSTIGQLADHLTKEAQEELGDDFTSSDIVKEETLPQFPFVFALRDDQGNVYTESEYNTFTKGRYNYIRIAFSGVDLFNVEKSTPSSYFPTPDTENSSYIYKGRFEPVYVADSVDYIYLDSYYIEDDVREKSFSDQIVVYRSDRRTELYDYSKERPKAFTADLTAASSKLSEEE